MSGPDELAAEHLRTVRRMYDAAPPEGCDDGDRTPALRRVAASLAGGYSTLDLDARDVRALVVCLVAAEGIIDSLHGQVSLLRGEVNELRARPVTAPDDTRAQAGECDVAAIGARAAAYESAAQAYATADHGAPSRIARLEMEDAAHESAADVPALLAWIASEPARVAAAVAAETQRCIAACEHVASQCTELDDRDLAMTCAEAIAVDAPAQGGG